MADKLIFNSALPGLERIYQAPQGFRIVEMRALPEGQIEVLAAARLEQSLAGDWAVVDAEVDQSRSSAPVF